MPLGRRCMARHQKYHWVTERRRAVVWGLGIPVVTVVGAMISPAAWAILLIYPLQVLRLSRQMGLIPALFNTVGKWAEGLGVLEFWLTRSSKSPKDIIEYK